MMNVISTLGIPFIMCLITAFVLGYLGLHVLKREVIFIDIAMAQIAAVGAIAGHIFWGIPHNSVAAFGISFASALVAALFFAVARRRISAISLEVVIGISYAAAASGALFLIGKCAAGHTHIQDMLTGNLLWINTKDLMWSVILFGLAGFFFHLFRRPFQRISDDYERAVHERVPVVLWDFIFYALCGAVIAQAVRTAGVIVTFIFLIVPATISALFSEGWKARLFIAWAFAAGASLFGLLFSYYFDFSTGVSVSLFVGISLVFGAMLKR